MFALCLIARSVFAIEASHVVISEVQTTGGTGATDQDFIEFHNPTSTPFDLNGYRLVKRTATGTTDTTIKSWTSPTMIAPGGYYLWANSNFSQGGVAANDTTSGTIADNNGVALRKGAENTGEIIDAVGWGTATNIFVEAAPAANPVANQSIERKPGGGAGNGIDTNNNVHDFFLQTTPNPKAGAAVVETPLPTDNAPVATIAGIVINEVAPNPLSGSEWIELFNTTAKEIDLTGATVEDGAGKIATIAGEIMALGFFVVEIGSQKLNNTGDMVKLVLHTTTIDTISYGNWNDGNTQDNAPVPKGTQSVARKSNGVDTQVDRDDFAATEESTKGTTNIILQRETASGGATIPSKPIAIRAVVVINEMVIDPGDNDTEWVELYNAGETSVDLATWTLEEGSGAKLKLSGTLMPGQFFVATKLPGVLDNAGDVVILRSDKEDIVDRVAYGSWDDGVRVDNAGIVHDPMSLGRPSDGLDTGNDAKDFTALTPTKGKSNALGVSALTVTIPDGAIIISEIHPKGEIVFIELMNQTDSYVRLTNWKIKDNKDAVTLIEDARLRPKGFFAVALAQELHEQKGSVALYDAKGHQKDKVMYRDGVPKKSYAFMNNDWLWIDPTPDKENIIAPQTIGVQNPPETAPATIAAAEPIAAPHIVISEIVPNPKGSDREEWLEIYWGGETPLPMDGYRLDTGTDTPAYTIHAPPVPPHTYLVFARAITKLTLHNAGGTIRLRNAAGAIVDTVSYPAGKEGMGWARQMNNQFAWSVPTRAAPNASVPLTANASGATTFGAGSGVVQGVVTAAPGVMSKTVFFIAGKESIQVYVPNSNVHLKEGDAVVVRGKRGVANHEPRITVREAKDIMVTGTGVVPAAPTVEAAQITDEDAGKLVHIAGTVADKQGSTLYIEDESGEVRVSLVSANRSSRPISVLEGATLGITGIVRTSSTGVRVVPRRAEDVVLTAAPVVEPVATVEIPESIVVPESSNTRLYLIATGVAAMSILGSFLIKSQGTIASVNQRMQSIFNKIRRPPQGE